MTAPSNAPPARLGRAGQKAGRLQRRGVPIVLGE